MKNCKESNNAATPTANKEAYVSASATLEGAIVIPLFIYAVVAVIYILQIMAVKTRVYEASYKSIKKMAAYAYTYEELKSNFANIDLIKNITGLSEDETSGLKSTMENGATIELFKLLLINELGADYAKNNNIAGGNLGFILTGSEVLKEGSLINIKIKYVIKNPFDIFGIGKVAVEQNLKTDAWLGENKDTFTSKGKSNEQEVYITSKGSVYHTKLTCTHLLRNIQTINASQIKDIRNSSGGIYYECEYCNDYDGSSVVYYTQYGSRYHKTSGCVQLQRTIIRVSLSEVKDRKLCEKCGSGE